MARGLANNKERRDFMSATRDGKMWRCQFYYKDWQGVSHKKNKRGFKTKAEAEQWERDFLQQQQRNLDINFENFVQIYYEDMEHRLRENTMRTKKFIIDLKDNPCRKAGSIGKSHAGEKEFWTKQEFKQFLVTVENKPETKMAFLLLYWTGMRIGELLALTYNDIDLEKRTISVNKSYQRIEGRDIITPPKTPKSKRIITIPPFLTEELKEYTLHLYGIMADERMFRFTKCYMEHEIIRGIKASGVKRIRLHDIHHSHASLLISKLGAQPNLVADRLGHEKIQTTLSTYLHLYPEQSRQLAEQMNALPENTDDEEE